MIFDHAEDIFRDAGFPASTWSLNIVIVGLAVLAFTRVVISTVDRLGRRVLMLAGPLGLAVYFGWTAGVIPLS